MRNNFDMLKPLTQGVHYLSRQEEDEMRKKMIEDEQLRSKIPDMKLQEDDSVLVEHIKKSVKDWQALPKDEQEPYLNIPAENAEEPIPSTLTRYQVRLTHQTVRNEYPNLKTQGMGHFVQVTNPTSKQQANEKDIRAKNRELEIAKAVGFRWILEAIMGGDISNIPHYYVVAGHPPEEVPKDVDGFLNELQTKLKSQVRAVVGHNCLTDVINLYRCFIGDLPEKVDDFCARLHELFPIVIDTKYVASLGNKRWTDTSLKSVESDLSSVGVPYIHLPTNFDRYVYATTYHEAGFDSFVTAKIGLKMPGKLRREHEDIKLLVERSAAVFEQRQDADSVGNRPEGVSDSPMTGADQKPTIAKNIVDMITSPVTTVKSMLIGTPSPLEQKKPSPVSSSTRPPTLVPASLLPTTGAVIATKQKSWPVLQESNNEIKKLGTMSKKSNIFDMLEDEPDDASEEEPAITERERIAGFVQEGRLMPQWEQDADFWKLISNKLQANATQEGVLDLTGSVTGQ